VNTLDEIKYFCCEKNSVGALLLTGQWGCGKTYLIEHQLCKDTEFTREFCLIRISLFGINSTDEIVKQIKQEYFYKLISKGNEQKEHLSKNINDRITSVKDVIPKIPIIGDVAGTVLSLNPGDFIEVSNLINSKKYPQGRSNISIAISSYQHQ
jgi:predicted AAA+ superfamily ATPase